VLVVDDIAASGDSLEFAVRLARDRGVKHLATAALVARPGRYRPDFSALESDQFFVFPWDYASLVADGRFEPSASRVPAKAAAKPRRVR
jgi:hypoxanthine phosphoribosyltransferase